MSSKCLTVDVTRTSTWLLAIATSTQHEEGSWKALPEPTPDARTNTAISYAHFCGLGSSFFISSRSGLHTAVDRTVSSLSMRPHCSGSLSKQAFLMIESCRKQ
eukprot:202912-Rhodomonas_salina.2